MNLKKFVKSIIQEVSDETQYEAICIIRSDRDRNITEILEELRGVCGITIVSSEPSKRLSANTEMTRVKARFFLTSPTISTHVNKMSFSARNISGVHSFRVLRAEEYEEIGGN
tara:strand:- start:1969 stop:2307 length:339 start_codon:yes stop_codon:yes gene_type:complete